MIHKERNKIYPSCPPDSSTLGGILICWASSYRDGTTECRLLPVGTPPRCEALLMHRALCQRTGPSTRGTLHWGGLGAQSEVMTSKRLAPGLAECKPWMFAIGVIVPTVMKASGGGQALWGAGPPQLSGSSMLWGISIDDIPRLPWNQPLPTSSQPWKCQYLWGEQVADNHVFNQLQFGLYLSLTGGYVNIESIHSNIIFKKSLFK